MNIKSVIIVLAAVLAGTLGGALTYQVAVPAGGAEPDTTESVVLKSPKDKARPERRDVRFAPCKRPAKLEGKRCVTDVVRTVVVGSQTQPATQSVPAAPAPVPVSSSGSDFNDDSRHGGGDDDSGYDDDDDNSGPGGGGDDDSHTGTHTRTRSHTSGGTHTQTRSHD
jgi:hypothetical protein